MRTSYYQYLTMLEYMEQHGDLSKPSMGARSRHCLQAKWMELCTKLNSDGTGDFKSEEKWRKVWSDWKCNIKKKYANIIKRAYRTGGGPALPYSLTDLEKRVLHVSGVLAAVGMPIAEAGFQQDDVHATHTEPTDPTDAAEFESNWNIPGISTQPTVVEPRQVTTPGSSEAGMVLRLSPSPPPLDEQWKSPPRKKSKHEDLAHMFIESDRCARMYARERDRVNEHLERERLRQRDEEIRMRDYELRERIRQRDEEIRMRDYELRERIRQRDLEIQLQAQWLEFMQECLNVIKKYFER